MSKPFQIEGVDYSGPGVKEVREAVVQLRDKALDQGQMGWSVLLSHNIALLCYLEEILENE